MLWGPGEPHTRHQQPGLRSRKEEEIAHLCDMRLLPRISVDPRELPQGSWPGEKVKSNKVGQLQLSSPVPEAELRSGAALTATLTCVNLSHRSLHLAKLRNPLLGEFSFTGAIPDTAHSVARKQLCKHKAP